MCGKTRCRLEATTGHPQTEEVCEMFGGWWNNKVDGGVCEFVLKADEVMMFDDNMENTMMNMGEDECNSSESYVWQECPGDICNDGETPMCVKINAEICEDHFGIWYQKANKCIYQIVSYMISMSYVSGFFFEFD